MAVLQIQSGGESGKQYPLVGSQIVIGRHPTCQVVLQNGAVSRQHAQILDNHGVFHIEDLRSRNKTFVNNEVVTGRKELQDGDEIRMCDVILTFLQHPSTMIPVISFEKDLDDLGARETIEIKGEFKSNFSVDESNIYSVQQGNAGEQELFEHSTSIRRMPADGSSESKIDPNVKLKALLEITQALGRELEVDNVLPKMLVTLFNIFPQAEQGFVLLKDTDNGKLKVKASRTRGGMEADSVAVSMTVVRHALQTREAILSDNVSDDSRFKSSTALSKMQIRSMMCVPMLSQDGEGLGVIQIVTRDEKNAFTEEDLDLLNSLASQASMAIENARMHEEDVRRHELERDLDFATQVQLGFLPKSRPEIPGYSFADYYEAAQSVGGDYFDYVVLPNGRVAMAIGDVAGKGMPAALLMARLYSSTRYQLLTNSNIEGAVNGLNEEISSSGLGHRFITFLIMIIDPETHHVELVNAGHLPPLLKDAKGNISAIGKAKSSLPLGIILDNKYEKYEFTLQPGDSIIAYTDGITEEMNPKRDIYGQERVEALFAKISGSIEDVIDEIVADVEAFGQGQASHDDTCIIGVRRSDS